MRTFKIIAAFAGVLFCTLAFCIATVIVHPAAPYVTLAILGLIAFSLPQIRRKHIRANMAFATVIVGYLLLLPLYGLFVFTESGFDDGPFSGRAFTGDTATLVEDESVPYRGGRIVVSNRSDEESPIMYFENDRGEVGWAIEMDVTTNPDHAEDRLDRVAHLEVERGLLRDIVHFTGFWTYGAEHGYAYLWKFSGFSKFYLSW